MQKAFLNFHFYGAGNIGDDLMLDGFFTVSRESKKIEEYTNFIPRDSESQKNRFPEISFYNTKEESLEG